MPIVTSSRQFNAWYAQQRRKSRLNPIAQAITKVFISLESTANMYYSLSAPITFADDFEIDYATSTTATAMNFADDFGISAGGLFVSPASVTDIELNGVSVGLAAAAPLDGKLNKVKFIGLVGETITVFGRSGTGTNRFNGILSDAKLTYSLTNAKIISFGSFSSK